MTCTCPTTDCPVHGGLKVELLPCPFCSGKPHIVSRGSFITDVFTVECPDCKCVGPDFHAKRFGDIAECQQQKDYAVFATRIAWNTRAIDAPKGKP